jgi:glycogen synthase
VPAVLAAADLLVLPSFYEELGTVLIEALQAGLPCVATRVGGIPEAVDDGETGLLVAPGDVEALTRAIQKLLANAELRRALGTQGRKRALERFPAEAMSRSFDELWREALR